MIGLLPILPAVTVPRQAAELGQALGKRFARFLQNAGMSEAQVRARGSMVAVRGRGVAAPQPAAARAPRARPARRAVGGRVPLAIRPAGALAAPPGPAVQHHHRRGGGVDRLRAGRVHQQPVRRQLQLARTGLVPGQLPVHRVAAALGRGPRRVVHGGVPDRLREAASPARRRRGPRPAARVHLAAGRGRSSARGGHRGEAARRPRVARPAAVPRVLPRRHRDRDRGLAPDRLDGPRRAPAGAAAGRWTSRPTAARHTSRHRRGPPVPGGPIGVM